jgi:hypothetical protein
VLKEHVKSLLKAFREALKHLFEFSVTTIGQHYRFISQLAYLAVVVLTGMHHRDIKKMQYYHLCMLT